MCENTVCILVSHLNILLTLLKTSMASDYPTALSLFSYKLLRDLQMNRWRLKPAPHKTTPL